MCQVQIPEDSSRNVTTTADCDYEIWMDVLEDLVGGLLTQLVYLQIYLLEYCITAGKNKES